MITVVLTIYLLAGIVAARQVRRRIPTTKITSVYDKDKHRSYCDVYMFIRKNGCDCGVGRQGTTESIDLKGVSAVLATVPLWPVALLMAVIFLDPPRRKPLVTVEEIERLEREAGI